MSGLIDAEGTFTFSFSQDTGYKTGWHIQPLFAIKLHIKDLPLLRKVKEFFAVGNIFIDKKNGFGAYHIKSLNDLKVILAHLHTYPLITQKRADSELFKLIIEIMSRKEHLTPEGLQRIVSIRASLNLGLSDLLRNAFPDIEPIPRPLVIFKGIPDPHWVAGFVDGEGCFSVEIRASKLYKTGYQVALRLEVAQHLRDQALIHGFIKYLQCGFVTKSSGKGVFKAGKFEDLNKKIIPFFNQFNLRGVKVLDFKDFCKIVKLMEAKAHLTREGLNEIRKIKSGMNSGRDHSNYES